MKSITFFLLLTLFPVFCFAQPKADESKITPEQGEIIFIRNSGLAGSLPPFSAFIDTDLACKINNKRYSKHVVAAGKHEFSAQYYGKKCKSKTVRTTVNVAPGEKKYVLIFQDYGWIAAKLYTVEVSEASANVLLAKMKEDRNYKY
jgi:hypothetical protein